MLLGVREMTDGGSSPATTEDQSEPTPSFPPGPWGRYLTYEEQDHNRISHLTPWTLDK